MGRSARRDFQKAYIDFATAMLDDRPSKKWREKLREEARDEWRDLDRGDRKAALAAFEDLTDLADARGGAAIEAAGEDMARLILWSLNPTPAMEASAIYRVIDREDPLWSWNEEANLELTIGDVAAMLALMDAKARDKRFDVDRFDRQNFDLVEEAGYVVADYFRNADVDEALMLSSFSVYAAGLEAHWDDMSRKERRDALGLMEGDAPKRSNMKEFLDAGDPFGPMRKAMNSVDWDDGGDGGGGNSGRKDYARLHYTLVQEIAGEKLTKSERKDLIAEGRAVWDRYDDEERASSIEKLTQRKQVADANGGPAVEDAGQDAIRNGLLSLTDGSNSFLGLKVINKHDPMIAWNAAAEVAVTRADVEAVAALWKAKAKDGKFDADRFDHDSFVFHKENMVDNFANVSVETAMKVSNCGSFAAGLEEAWDDLTRSERREALDMPWEDGLPSEKLMRKIIGADDFYDLRARALAQGGIDEDLLPGTASGGGGGSPSGDASFDANYLAIQQAQNDYWSRELVYTDYFGFSGTTGW